MNTDMIRTIMDMRMNQSTVNVSSIDQDGYPITRAMQVIEHGSYQTHYFVTSASSGKVQDYSRNPQASVYYSEERYGIAVLFIGKMEVCTDLEAKKRLWRKSFQKYYPLGLSDPDYCVLKFTVEAGRFYRNSMSETFMIKELIEAIIRNHE